MKAVEEIYRISKNGAKNAVAVPCFRSHYACLDPTHEFFLELIGFNYFDPRHIFQRKMQYSQAKFNVEKVIFDREWLESKSGFSHGLLIKWANNNLERYESRLSHFFPLNSLTFHLTIIK